MEATLAENLAEQQVNDGLKNFSSQTTLLLGTPKCTRGTRHLQTPTKTTFLQQIIRLNSVCPLGLVGRGFLFFVVLVFFQIKSVFSAFYDQSQERPETIKQRAA